MSPIVLAHGIARFDILREKIAQELNIPLGWWDSQEAVNPLIGDSLLGRRDEFESTIKSVHLESLAA